MNRQGLFFKSANPRLRKSAAGDGGKVLNGRNRQQGFTLMETLVAISVLSIAMVVILQLFSGGLRGSKVSDDYTRGIFHAKEVMEEMLLPHEFGEGVRQGDFDDGYRWQSEIVRQTPETEDEESLPFDTYLITVSVNWPTGQKERRFDISTLRLMEKEEE